jgi:PilZ domain
MSLCQIGGMTDVQPSAEIIPLPNAEQRRIAKRLRVLKSGKIVLDDWSSLDCTIRDMSETGAKVRVDHPEKVPHKCRLFVQADNTIRPVQVAWTRDGEIGIAFTGPAKSAALRKF